MPYDSVYLEKRPPGALRTVWRKFYGDTTAMIGLYVTPYGAQRAGRTLFQINAIVGHTIPYVSVG